MMLQFQLLRNGQIIWAAQLDRWGKVTEHRMQRSGDERGALLDRPNPVAFSKADTFVYRRFNQIGAAAYCARYDMTQPKRAWWFWCCAADDVSTPDDRSWIALLIASFQFKQVRIDMASSPPQRQVFISYQGQSIRGYSHTGAWVEWFLQQLSQPGGQVGRFRQPPLRVTTSVITAGWRGYPMVYACQLPPKTEPVGGDAIRQCPGS